MQIIPYFSSPIATFKNENFDLTEHCLEIKEKNLSTNSKAWIHMLYNTLSTQSGYNTSKDPKFFELTKWIQECVNEFTIECGYEKMSPFEMWFNVYKNGDSQEFHNHARSHVSCIYVAEAQKDDSRIFFNRSPVPMFPIPIRNSDEWNYDQVWFPSEKGLLLIFKSDTMHMVEKKVTDTPRITFAYNFLYHKMITQNSAEKT
jgi:uncharacterized protein (TIGR02466 family)